MLKRTKEDTRADREGFYRYKLHSVCAVIHLPKGTVPGRIILNELRTNVMPRFDRVKLVPVWVKGVEALPNDPRKKESITLVGRRVYAPQRKHSRRKKAHERGGKKK